MKPHFAENPEFRRLLDGSDRVDLVRLAFEIASDAYPSLDPSPYLARIEELAERVRSRCPAGARVSVVLRQINWALFVEEGFHGNRDAYDDPRNSYLNEVLDRKTGIPISLCVLYEAVAHRLGLDIAGVNLPAHFMLRAVDGDRLLFIDPFHEGEVLDRQACERRLSNLLQQPVRLTDDLIAPCPPRAIVARMLRNLKGLFLQAHDFPAMLPVQRRLAALQASDPIEHRDLGMTYLFLDRPGDAIHPLERYLTSVPAATDASEIGRLLSAARRNIAERN
jgi:regulator of sirC expression with transglutaminase-like and TPR domain